MMKFTAEMLASANHEIDDNELDNVSGGYFGESVVNGIKGLFGGGTQDKEDATITHNAGGPEESTQGGAEVLANTGTPGATVSTGTGTVVSTPTPATVEQNVAGSTIQSLSSGSETNPKSRRNKRSF